MDDEIACVGYSRCVAAVPELEGEFYPGDDVAGCEECSFGAV